MLSAFYAECLLCWVPFMLSAFYAEYILYSVSFMLSVLYAECLLCWVPFMPSVTIKSSVLNVIMPSVVVLNVVAPNEDG
jgi:hypothetical protein